MGDQDVERAREAGMSFHKGRRESSWLGNFLYFFKGLNVREAAKSADYYAERKKEVEEASKNNKK